MIAEAMGESMALWYIKSVAGPRVLHGCEMISDPLGAGEAREMWNGLLCKALSFTNHIKQKQEFRLRPEVFIPKTLMAAETDEKPWDIQFATRSAGLLWRIHQDDQTMAGKRVHHSVVEGATLTQMRERTNQTLKMPPPNFIPKWEWKSELKVQATDWMQVHLQDYAVAVDKNEDEAGDRVAALVVRNEGGESQIWDTLLPKQAWRHTIRRVRLGHVMNTRKYMARRERGWSKLNKLEKLKVAACTCCVGEEQTASHVVMDCPLGEQLRDRVTTVATKVASELGAQGWGTKDPERPTFQQPRGAAGKGMALQSTYGPL